MITRLRARIEGILYLLSVGCGHTYANFFNQSKDIKQGLFEQSARLPFYFRWIDGKMVVTRDFTDPAILPVGSEVTRISGIKSSAVSARRSHHRPAGRGQLSSRHARAWIAPGFVAQAVLRVAGQIPHGADRQCRAQLGDRQDQGT